MEDVLVRILGFVTIIAVGFFARKGGLVKREQGVLLGNIVMTITLPCSLVSGMNGSEFDPSIFIIFILGLCSSIVLIAAGFLRAHGQDMRTRVLELINTGGYNMGNFAIPFVSSFYPSAALPYVCLFDAGGAIMTLGATASVARGLLSGNARFSVRDFLRVLFSSPAFDTYMILIALSAFHVSLPGPVVTIAGMIGNANTFLAMFMVGVMLDPHFDRETLGSVFRIISTRYVFAAVFAAASYYLLPFPNIVRQVIAISFLSPLATVNSIYSAQMGLDKRVPAAVMTISIFISTVLMSGATILFTV